MKEEKPRHCDLKGVHGRWLQQYRQERKERLLGARMAGGGWLELEGLAGWKGCLGVKLEVMEMMIQLGLGREGKGAEMGVDSSTSEAGGLGGMARIMV